MPGPFTHIYTARRVADYLDISGFTRREDGELAGVQALDRGLLEQIGGAQGCARVMRTWERYTALGAIGPDLFFFMQDYRQEAVQCDELMLAMSALYLVDDARREDWEPFLVILDQVNHTWAQILRFLIKLDKIWQKFMKVWKDTIGKVVNAVGQFIDDMSGGMLSTLGTAISELADELIGLLVEDLITRADILSWFSLGMREGVDEQLYLWSDMLHYRRTSEMGQALVRRALAMRGDDVASRERSEQFLAYALGFVCHLGTDVVAHSFVNEQCGGPFRTHWGRHHLIENHIDAWNYHETRGAAPALPADPFCAATDAFPALNQSALYFALQLTPTEPNGKPRPASLPDDPDDRKAALDADGELPDWLAEGIVGALIDTYGKTEPPATQPEHPQILKGSAFQQIIANDPVLAASIVTKLTGADLERPVSELIALLAPSSNITVPHGFPLPWEVKVSYRFMLSFFKRTYVDSLNLQKPRRPVIFTPPASDFDFGPPDFSGVNSSDSPAENLWDALKALFSWAWKTLKKAAQAAYDLVKTAASAGTIVPRTLIYDFVIEPAWHSVENVREILTHIGLLMPQDEERYPDNGELAKPSEIDTELIRLGHSVDAAFKQALADSGDTLGNLDKDSALLPDAVQNPRSAQFPFYPVRKQGSDAEYTRPWAYPSLDNDRNPNPVELSPTMSGPYPANSLPNVLLRPDGPASNERRLAYEEAASPAVTDRLNLDIIGHDPDDSEGPIAALGDPIPFSAYLIGQIAANPHYHTNFNLDADRGYAYHCWDWNRDQDSSHPKSHGQRGLDFRTPCAWPEGANGWKGAMIPMALHYKETQDPGCPPPPAPPDGGQTPLH